MKTEDKICQQCGTPLADEAPEGLCPKCLLKGGLPDGLAAYLSSTEDKTVVESKMASGQFSSKHDGLVEAQAGEGGTQPFPQIANRRSRVANPIVRYFGDYELLEEIARGGMGVVYKARQASLNRTVAVKMILAGHLATEAEIRRFRTEAEAAANLQHPNIVAIHEIGEHEGQHYFSMDFVEGRNLSQLTAGKPLPSLRAAKYVKAIAEAIHFAHQRGTLHRDLKPLNVLVDAADQPRITDFGLAKQLKHDSSLTRSGAVLGSPSYMPPELAQGRHDLVGPQSDVYSLGAILYELLTGQAPFLANTPMATMVQVVEQEPVAPSKHNPHVPPDLETICLKCLEKSPERRYPTARALAEELERFLNHEPILARPAGRMRKSWSWLQKHPWAITGMAAVTIIGLVCTAYGMWEHNRFLLWQAAHPETVFRPGFQLLLITSWLGLMLSVWPCGWAELKLRHHFRRHRELGTPIPRSIVRVSILLGGIVILYCLALLLKQVELWAWRPRQILAGGELNVNGALNAVVSVWAMMTLITGGVLVWKAIGASDLSAFSELVAQTMEAADAREEHLTKRRSQRKTVNERVLPHIILPLWVVLSSTLPVFWFGGVAQAADETNVRHLKWAVWIAGQAAWLLPACLFAPWRQAELSRRVAKRRTMVVGIDRVSPSTSHSKSIVYGIDYCFTINDLH